MHVKNINQLPTELLVKIFLRTQKPSYKDRYPHLHLSSVCRHWRRIIIDHGVFWTVIYFSPWKGEESIRESVTRSRSQELSVFSSFDYNACTNNENDSRLERAQIREIVTTFDNLIQTEGHRIKFLCLVEDCTGKLPRAVLGKALPVLKTFIFDKTDLLTEGSDSFAIIKAAKSLENLNINLQQTSIRMSSLSELKPSFEHLRNLKLRFISGEVKKHIFISVLPFCYKLESLTVSWSENWDSIHLSSVITLKNLISLNVDCYALVHKLRAPALRTLSLSGSNRLEPDQHDYLILDEYDVSPVTQLVIKGFDILAPQDSSAILCGFTGSKSWNEDSWTPFEIDGYTDCGHIDLRRDDINTSSSGPTQFCIELPMYHTPNNGVAPPNFQPSPVLSKILSKLHNLERLYITPFNFWGHVPDFSQSIFESLKEFLKIIFDNLTSSKIKRLGIKGVGRNVDTLRLTFDLVNNCFALSNLDTMELETSRSSLWHHSDVSLGIFADELVNSLQLRQDAGHRALPRLDVNLHAPLPKKCIAEAAVLGTQVVQCIKGKR